MKKTLVLGASVLPSRYSFLAIRSLRRNGHEVVGVGRDTGLVGDVNITSDFPKQQDIDTITVYLNPRNQKEYYDKIIALKPRRIIFNPGAENSELEELARKNGIETEYACTLVMLSSGHY
jgi:predicted CoA-binding protein